MDKSYDVDSLERIFEEEYGKSVGYRPKELTLIISLPQRDKVIFKGWDMCLRDGVWRDIPEGTVFKVVHVTKDGKFIKGFNPNFTLSDIVFHSTEVEFAKVPVECKGMDW